LIEVDLVLDSWLCIEQLRVHGHSIRLAHGASVPCAAVSALARTAARVIEADTLLRSEGGADHEGSLELRVQDCPVERREWLRGVSDSLLVGLRDVEAEYPDDCRVRLHTQEECRNGT